MSRRETGVGLRPHIRVEMLLRQPALPPIRKPVGSLIAAALQKPPEVAAFPCVDPVETAADKLSALAWRVHARRRGTAGDDPTIIRHLHDLAALKTTVEASPAFATLARKAMADDTGRGGQGAAISDPATLLAALFERLDSDPLWASEYEDYVRQVSFADPGHQIRFAQALVAVRDLAAPLVQAGAA
jgi:hypothetical protein